MAQHNAKSKLTLRCTSAANSIHCHHTHNIEEIIMDDKLGQIFIGLAAITALIALYVSFTAPNPEGFSMREVVKDIMLITQVMISVLATGALIKYLTR